MDKLSVPICARCNSPLRLSESALRYMEKLSMTGRPATCAKCAVDDPGVSKKKTAD